MLSHLHLLVNACGPVAMLHVAPIVSSPCFRPLLLSPATVGSDDSKPPLQSTQDGQKLTSLLCTDPKIHLALSTPPWTPVSHDSLPLSPLLSSSLERLRLTEILRHGKHAQQNPSSPPQPTQAQTGAVRSTKASPTQATQPQQAQAYHSIDMHNQGPTASNGLSNAPDRIEAYFR